MTFNQAEIRYLRPAGLSHLLHLDSRHVSNNWLKRLEARALRYNYLAIACGRMQHDPAVQQYKLASVSVEHIATSGVQLVRSEIYASRNEPVIKDTCSLNTKI
jgi:hypothetical protein